MIDELLEKFGLKWEDLDSKGHSGEKEYLLSMLSAVENNQVTLQTFRDHVASMKSYVEQQLVNEPEFNYIFIFKVPNRKQIYLKARLQNYLLMEAYLSTPDQAKKALEAQIKGLAKRKLDNK
jgi:hypothetical protein